MGLDVYTSAGARLTSPQLPTYVTSLPSGPIDGQEVYYAADATNGVIWHLRYRSGSSSSYKWEFVGGAYLTSSVTTTQTTTSTSFTDLATSGPSITTPLAGDYVLVYGCYTTVNATAQATYTAPSVGATAASDDDRAGLYSGGAAVTTDSVAASVVRQVTKTGVAASTALTLKYRVSGGTGTFAYRHLTVRPVRVG